jgi:hypothetical protein
MANRSLRPPLALCQINYEHIYNRHVEKQAETRVHSVVPSLCNPIRLNNKKYYMELCIK